MRYLFHVAELTTTFCQNVLKRLERLQTRLSSTADHLVTTSNHIKMMQYCQLVSVLVYGIVLVFSHQVCRDHWRLF